MEDHTEESDILKILHDMPLDGIERVDDIRFKIEEWTETFNDEIVINFQMIHMKDSYYVWIGARSFSMDDLQLAMKTRYSETPLTMGLFDLTSPGCQIAQRLCKKTGKTFYVSLNVQEMVPHLVEFIEIKLSKKF